MVAVATSAPVPTYILLDGCGPTSSGSGSRSTSTPVCDYETPCFFLCAHMPPPHLAVDDPSCETFIRHTPTGKTFCVSATNDELVGLESPYYIAAPPHL